MPEKVDSHRLNVRELEKSEKDMLLLGVLASIQFDKEETGKGKKGSMRSAGTLLKEKGFVQVHFVSFMI